MFPSAGWRAHQRGGERRRHYRYEEQDRNGDSEKGRQPQLRHSHQRQKGGIQGRSEASPVNYELKRGRETTGRDRVTEQMKQKKASITHGQQYRATTLTPLLQTFYLSPFLRRDTTCTHSHTRIRLPFFFSFSLAKAAGPRTLNPNLDEIRQALEERCVCSPYNSF